jgi:hypothetical protein
VRASLALILHILEVDIKDIPEFLKSQSTTTRELRDIIEEQADLHAMIKAVEKRV